jgi:signal transduction histidine kinase/DNA-binding response OmpR family regulator/CHASE3 domain sensor protein
MKSNFKRNLLIGFSVSMTILIATSVASYISISRLLQSADLVSHTNEVIVQLNEINTAIIDAETGQRGYLIAGENEFLEPFINARERAFGAYDNVKRLTVDNQQQQEKLPALRRLMEGRFRYLETAIETRKAGQEISLPSLRLGRQAMDEIRQEVADLKLQETTLLEARTSSMNQFARTTSPLVITGAIIALILAGVFYFRVSSDYAERVRLQEELQEKDRETRNRINIIQNIAEKVSAGSYSIRVDDKQTDALGAVAGSLNRMAGSLQHSFELLSDKDWLQTGLTNLNNLMIGEKEIETLSAEVIASIASYTDSNAGALYILDGSELKRSGGYAFTPEKTRERIKLNEGIIGQAVASGKPVELRDIPRENVSISFATGEVKPKHVVAVPVMDGYTVKGAIEIATINEFSKRQIDFLTHAAPNVGIAISTAQNRRRLQELLEETQAQSEELRTQHSELENMNSELEVQTERLQTSEEELKVQQEELKQANTELEERSRLLEEKNHMIGERNIEIQSKADELARTTKYKSEFLANMSHELRTPLNSILLLSRLMSENSDNNLTPDQAEYARVIQTSGQGLLSLIDEILDLSKIESGKMNLEYQDVSLNEIIQNMKLMFGPLAKEKKIEFKTYVAENAPERIEIDKLRLEQVIRNLLSNAIKFTANGYVQLGIEAANDGNTIRFVVKDTGIGIAKDKQSIVFEAFQQADGSTRRKYGGTGLGLSISRELVRLLGGEISLTSEPDQGSEFILTLPARKGIKDTMDISAANETRTPARKTALSRKALVDTSQVSIVPPTNGKFISTTIPENIPDDRNEVTGDDKTILIIEDDTAFARALLEFTRKKGYKGIVSVRGDEAVDLARHFAPVGILLDIQLPVKSGWDVMEELKSKPETRHIPVHIMSSHEMKSESIAKGAVDHITKPVTVEQMQEIFRKIEHVLQHHPKKVLIVEENEQHAKALAYFLETFDVNLEIRNEVNSAISSLQNDNVDCVILDMGIPDKQAYDTLEVIKKTPGLEHLPIIIFTGKSLSQPEVMKIRQYADSIVVKTAFSYKRILDEVSLFLHLMEKHRQPAEVQPPKYHKLGALDEVLKNKTVLIADDDMRNIFSLTKALEKYQMNVIAAVDGKDALKKLKAASKVDIVLMDMMMPEMDGYETTMAIRKEKKYKDIPVIAVTAKAMMGDREKCINAGASDYITKPVDIDQLFSLLRVWLYESGRK